MGSWLTCLVISYCFLTLYRNEGNFVQGEDLAIKNASENNYKYAEPTVMIAILVRNKAHILPWFFGHLEKLNYPKNRISFWWVLLIFFFFSKKSFYAFLLITNDMNSPWNVCWWYFISISCSVAQDQKWPQWGWLCPDAQGVGGCQ